MKKDRLKNFPISFFAVSMGLTGSTIVMQKMEIIAGWPAVLSSLMLCFAMGVFAVLTIFYFAKILFFPEIVVKELTHPVRMHFAPTFSVTMLLISVATLNIMSWLSALLWYVGASIHIIFTFYTLTTWIQYQKFEPHHANPSWFIPILGNLVVPVAGVAFVSPIVNWFFFSIGFMFWILLFSVILNRLIFHSPLPEKLMPTLFILIAPPAVAFIAFVKMTGEAGNFGMFLYGLSLFLFLLVFAQWRLLYNIKFYLSWWAYSFPISSTILASVQFYHITGETFAFVLSVLMSLLLLVVIVLLSILTIGSIRRGEICIEE
jgi:tellurite resistance protein